MEQKALLEVSSVTYISGNGPYASLPLAIPKQRDVVRALENCDRNGRFTIRRYSGIITKVNFEGKRKLTRAELDEILCKRDYDSTVESVELSFDQWWKEGRPLRVSLSRQTDIVGIKNKYEDRNKPNISFDL